MGRNAIAVACLLGTLGCAGVSVTPQTNVPPAPTSRSTVVIGALAGADSSDWSWLNGAIVEELRGAKVAERLVDEHELGPDGMPGRAFALRYKVLDDNFVVTNTGRTCITALTATGLILLVPLFFIGTCTRSAEATLTVGARVFDVSDAPVVKITDATTNQSTNAYDTSTLTPIMDRSYSVKVAFSVPAACAFAALSSDAACDARPQAVAAAYMIRHEIARQIVARSLGDITHALAAESPASTPTGAASR